MTPGCLHVATLSFTPTFQWLKPGLVFSGPASKLCPLPLSNALSLMAELNILPGVQVPKDRFRMTVTSTTTLPPPTKTDHCLNASLQRLPPAFPEILLTGSHYQGSLSGSGAVRWDQPLLLLPNQHPLLSEMPPRCLPVPLPVPRYPRLSCCSL